MVFRIILQGVKLNELDNPVAHTDPLALLNVISTNQRILLTENWALCLNVYYDVDLSQNTDELTLKMVHNAR